MAIKMKFFHFDFSICAANSDMRFKVQRCQTARVKKHGLLVLLGLLPKYTADDAIEGCKGAKPCLDDGKELLPVLV